MSHSGGYGGGSYVFQKNQILKHHLTQASRTQKKRKIHSILTPFLGAGTPVRFFCFYKKIACAPQCMAVQLFQKVHLGGTATGSKSPVLLVRGGGGSPSLAGI